MDEIKHLKLQLLYMSNMVVKHRAFLLFSATSCQKALCLCVEIMSHSGSDAVHLYINKFQIVRDLNPSRARCEHVQ